MIWIDLNMAQTENGSWTTIPAAKLREDVKAWTVENDVQVSILYPFDGKTLIFKSVEEALLFKLRWA